MDALEKGALALKEMQGKVVDWYNWTIENEIEIHPHNDYVPREFLQKINQWMMPYISRLHDTDHITLDQMNDFSDFVAKHVRDLRVKAEEATWLYHWQEMSFWDRMKWRWKNKRIKRYGLRDFERLCTEARFVPFI
jgi:hypothetical protein